MWKHSLALTCWLSFQIICIQLLLKNIALQPKMSVVMAPSILNHSESSASIQNDGSGAGVPLSIASFIKGYSQAIDSIAEVTGLNASSVLLLSLLASGFGSVQPSNDSSGAGTVQREPEDEFSGTSPGEADESLMDPHPRPMAGQQDGVAAQAAAAEELSSRAGDPVLRWKMGNERDRPQVAEGDPNPIQGERANPKVTFDSIFGAQKMYKGESN